MIKVGIIGSVTSTAVTLNKVLQNDFEVVGVLGYAKPANKDKIVSGWYDLENISIKKKLPFQSFKSINSSKHLRWMEKKSPDVIFAVGLSQILSKEWLEMPAFGCVGFHPTLLPKGRGRAPLAWLVLNEERGAATFFQMDDKADNGPIFVQKPFEISDHDDASSVRLKILDSIEIALDDWLPELSKGIWNPVPQNEEEAYSYGKRAPSDGIIEWQRSSAREIHQLIKATAYPHPGAFTFYNNRKFVVWKSGIEKNLQIKGVPGRILKTKDGHLLVQCAQGLLWITDYECSEDKRPRVGERLGYNIEVEIFKIWKKLNNE